MSDSKYNRTVLDNGLRIITEKMPYLKSVSVGIWVDVGSRNETDRENGISHFIEHMCFKGTPKRNAKEIASSLESLGGSLNAFTTRENTCYYARVLDEHFEIGFDVLSDILTNSLFDAQELEREKDVICEEIKDVFDTPGELIHDYFAEAIWKPHPLGQTIMGTAEGIRKLKRPDLIDYISRNYSTNRIILAVAGAIEHEQVVEMAKEKLQFNNPTTTNGMTAPNYVDGLKKVISRDLQQTHLCLGFPSIPFYDKNRYAVLILNTLLGSGMASRLFQSVREEKGLCYTIYSYQDFYHDTGLFGIYLGTDSTKSVEAVDTVLKELSAVRTNSITEGEIQTCKSQLKGNLMLALEGSYNRMNRLARHELFLKNYSSLEQTAKEIDAVTLSSVRDVANELFSEKKMTMVAMGSVDEALTSNIEWSILRG